MDFRRLAIAIVLCLIVFVSWEMFFIDKKVIQSPSKSLQTEQTAKETQFNKDIEKGIVDKKIISEKSGVSRPIKKARTITVNTPLYSVKISENGAAFNSFALKDYKTANEENSPLYEMIPTEIQERGTVLLGLASNSLLGLKQAVFSVNNNAESININDKPEKITFSWASENGVIVEKSFVFSPETYL
ncbi:MAG: membrane protein insertase YidC, partial [Desulfobacterales bacterium]|nr:membrane protein insertase YidC [Desulfobacterales bacterium]